jgi:ER-bound oxygenase mpaB/B'/Rubber oxygenase, catalytic domain
LCVPAKRNLGSMDGLFPEDAVIRRIGNESIVLLGGGRALLMQLAHPKVAAGVADHSGFEADPFGRLRRTLEAVNTIVYGTAEEADRVAKILWAVHERVTGADYRANDPELLLWVNATLIDTALRIHPRRPAVGRPARRAAARPRLLPRLHARDGRVARGQRHRSAPSGRRPPPEAAVAGHPSHGPGARAHGRPPAPAVTPTVRPRLGPQPQGGPPSRRRGLPPAPGSRPRPGAPSTGNASGLTYAASADSVRRWPMSWVSATTTEMTRFRRNSLVARPVHGCRCNNAGESKSCAM